MRDVEFKTWRDFWETLWKLVANNPVLPSQFKNLSVQRMKAIGQAPRVPSNEQIGALKAFVLHHVIPIQNGGAVYDVDNPRVATPLEHNQIHYSKGGENEKIQTS